MSDVFDRIAGRAAAAAQPTVQPTPRLTARREPRFAEAVGRADDDLRGDADDGQETLGGSATGRVQPSPDEGHRNTTLRIGKIHDDRADGGRPVPPVAPVRPASAIRSTTAHAEPDHAREPAGATSAHALAAPPAVLAPTPRSTSSAPDPEQQREPSPPTRQATRADRGRVEDPLPPGPLRARGRRRPDPAPAPIPVPEGRVVSAEELLREQVAPALVAQGVVSVRSAERLTALGLDAVEVPAGGDVHVHIAHVVVRQPEAPAPPEPARAGGTRDHLDHADYLARQQRRWS